MYFSRVFFIPEINETTGTFTKQHRELISNFLEMCPECYPLNMVGLHGGFTHSMRLLGFKTPLKQSLAQTPIPKSLGCVHSPAPGNSSPWQGFGFLALLSPRVLEEAQPRFWVLQDSSESMATEPSPRLQPEPQPA